MSAVLGSVGDPAGLLDPDVESILEEKNQLISRQYAEIERLQRELSEVIGERDALLCEVSKFKFEREMTDLTRLLDDRYFLSSLLYLQWLTKVFQHSQKHITYSERQKHADSWNVEIKREIFSIFLNIFKLYVIVCYEQGLAILNLRKHILIKLFGNL